MAFIYSYILYPLLLAGFWVLSFKDEKVRKGFALRKNKAWLKPLDEKASWIWFHVASGELEYAKPVIREIKSHSQKKILVTYFSPSVLGALEKNKDVDLFVPMPWDTPWNWREFLNHFRPQVLAIARTDTWPNMVWETRKKNIPSILFSATLPRHSGRYASFWGRLLYGSIVESLTEVSCVTPEDRDHFLRLDADLNVNVDGDTRFDQVITRVGENRPVKEAVAHAHPCFVIGSSWPEDEKIILPALKTPTEKGLKVILAPHEPTPSHLQELEERLGQLGIKSHRYSTLDKNLKAPIVIVDQVGILADLYRLGTVAFVGGSFKKSVHSVMEPAASGALSLFGPYHHNSREALALKTHGFAREIETSHDLEKILLEEMLKTPQETTGRKNAVLNFVAANRGVSAKIAQWILNHSLPAEPLSKK